MIKRKVCVQIRFLGLDQALTPQQISKKDFCDLLSDSRLFKRLDILNIVVERTLFQESFDFLVLLHLTRIDIVF